MKKVFKFPLDADFVAYIPKGYEILKVGKQNGTLMVWALVNPISDAEEARFYIYGTGETVGPFVKKHIDTIFDGPFVWHVFM